MTRNPGAPVEPAELLIRARRAVRQIVRGPVYGPFSLEDIAQEALVMFLEAHGPDGDPRALRHRAIDATRRLLGKPESGRWLAARAASREAPGPERLDRLPGPAQALEIQDLAETVLRRAILSRAQRRAARDLLDGLDPPTQAQAVHRVQARRGLARALGLVS